MSSPTTTASAPTATPTAIAFSKGVAVVAGISIPLAIVGIICLVLAFRMRKRLRAAWAGPVMGTGMPAIHDPEAEARAAREQKRQIKKQLKESTRKPQRGDSVRKMEEGNGGYGIQVGAPEYAMILSPVGSKETHSSRDTIGSKSTVVTSETMELKEIAVHELSA